MGPEREPEPLLVCLRDDLGYRRIQQGFRRLDSIRSGLESLEPGPDAGVLVGLVAQWVDAGFAHHDLLRRVLSNFPKGLRPSLPLLDYLHLRMAEAAAAMDGEDFEGAAGHLRIVLSFQEEVDDIELLAIANFWMGRSLRKMGQYDEALRYTAQAEHLALSAGYLQMAAIMQVTMSWLAFQKGRLHEANALLHRAEEALVPTDDHPSLGNIQSAYGRIARRQGKYAEAVERFERAIAEFRYGDGDQLHLARTLLNLAFAQRLLAVREQRELDQVTAVRRGKSAEAPAAADQGREQRLRIARIQEEAQLHLEEAAEIYARHQNHRGIAGVHINRGFLHLDAGDLECAAAEAAEGFAYGSGKSDYITMARARTLQCMVELAIIEEQLGDPARHREAAEAYARDAVTFAGRTENRRLLARAAVWQGLTFILLPADLEAARRCYEQAVALLQPEGAERQYVWEELETLKTRVLGVRPVDAALRAWSAGIIEGGRTFQQVTEEFARIVIPRVWEREERKVSRVAAKLSISPKKVRRILHAAGFNEKRYD
jgi:tetratricopeptide (TPR) repeat protein